MEHCLHVDTEIENGYPRCQECKSYKDPVKGWALQYPIRPDFSQLVDTKSLPEPAQNLGVALPDRSNTKPIRTVSWDSDRNGKDGWYDIKTGERIT